MLQVGLLLEKIKNPTGQAIFYACASSEKSYPEEGVMWLGNFLMRARFWALKQDLCTEQRALSF